MNTYTVMVDCVFYPKHGRSSALRRCAWEAPALRDEFHKFAGVVSTSDEFAEKTRAFVREKGLRILNEKPIVRNKDDRYVVDVYYTIGW